MIFFFWPVLLLEFVKMYNSGKSAVDISKNMGGGGGGGGVGWGGGGSGEEKIIRMQGGGGFVNNFTLTCVTLHKSA